jgi:hypothetical protein
MRSLSSFSVEIVESNLLLDIVRAKRCACMCEGELGLIQGEKLYRLSNIIEQDC